MDPDQSTLNFEAFQRWDIAALKKFLKDRGVSLTGSKAVLVARAFNAQELNFPVLPTEKQRDEIREREYQSLLVTDEGTVPDPVYELLTGWQGEDKAITSWPPTMKDEISKYLKKHETFIDQVSLSKRLFRDYKEQKAYSYFDSEFMFEAFYHPIVFESQYCFIKAKCTPSQRINDVPHDVWVLLNKFSGDIKSGYCTCFAGLGQSCNHVAALLFKINHAWETGLSQVSVTSKLSTWNRSKKVIESIKVKDMHVVKPKAERSIRMGDRVNTVTKRLFSVHNSEKGMTENEFLERLQEISPDSVTLGERKPQRHPVYCQYDQELSASPSLPPSVENLASMCQTVEELETKIFTWPFDECDAVEIESNTRNQGSEVWCAQRKGRVTASNFHRVHTRMQSYNRTCDIDMSACISDVLGYSQPNGELRALKYGRNMEDKACKEYEQYLKSKGHKNVNVQRCGLFVNVSSPYLGASPDRIISCDCCPKRVLEVKCPMTCMHESPSSSNVECLVEVNGEVKLKNSHKYFTQVQGQMAIANCDYADFFVFSPHGFHVETIRFNEQLWSNISTNLTTFFLSFVIPELVTRNVQKSMSMKPDVKHKVSRVPAQVKSKQKGKGRGKSTKRKSYHPVYTCGACKSRFKDNCDMKDIGDFSIYCDGCCKWYHWLCVDIVDEADTRLENEEFFCKYCAEMK